MSRRVSADHPAVTATGVALAGPTPQKAWKAAILKYQHYTREQLINFDRSKLTLVEAAVISGFERMSAAPLTSGTRAVDTRDVVSLMEFFSDRSDGPPRQEIHLNTNPFDEMTEEDLNRELGQLLQYNGKLKR